MTMLLNAVLGATILPSTLGPPDRTKRCSTPHTEAGVREPLVKMLFGSGVGLVDSFLCYFLVDCLVELFPSHLTSTSGVSLFRWCKPVPTGYFSGNRSNASNYISTCLGTPSSMRFTVARDDNAVIWNQTAVCLFFFRCDSILFYTH